VTGFGSFDNSTCKRVLDLLKPGDLKLEQVVIKSVAVVELGVNNGSGDGGSCLGIEVWTDTAKLEDMVIARLGDRKKPPCHKPNQYPPIHFAATPTI